MPLLHYEQLTVQKNVESEITVECFQEPFSIHHSLLDDADQEVDHYEEHEDLITPLDHYIDARLIVQAHIEGRNEGNIDIAPQNTQYSCFVSSDGKAKENFLRCSIPWVEKISRCNVACSNVHYENSPQGSHSTR